RLRSGEVALALLDDDRLLEVEVAYADLPGGHLGQGAVAAIISEPGGAANRCRRVAADGAERALAAAPQVAHRLALCLLAGPLAAEHCDLRVLRGSRAALEAAAEQIEIRDPRLTGLHLGLGDPEDAAVELGGVEPAAAVVDR